MYWSYQGTIIYSRQYNNTLVDSPLIVLFVKMLKISIFFFKLENIMMEDKASFEIFFKNKIFDMEFSKSINYSTNMYWSRPCIIYKSSFFAGQKCVWWAIKDENSFFMLAIYIYSQNFLLKIKNAKINYVLRFLIARISIKIM